MLRRAGVVLIVAMLALGLGGALAGAKKHKKKGHAWASKVTLAHPSPTAFSGKANSSLAGCRKHRLVNVFYTDPGSATTTLLSVQRTDGKGRYEIGLSQDAFAGTYQAQLVKQRIRARKAPQTCKGAVSGIVGL
ncbi:MAG TPA: hypothetical protein VGE91_07340 [Solirubrobacterales bacterium]|jgi:hypothetical protein